MANQFRSGLIFKNFLTFFFIAQVTNLLKNPVEALQAAKRSYPQLNETSPPKKLRTEGDIQTIPSFSEKNIRLEEAHTKFQLDSES